MLLVVELRDALIQVTIWFVFLIVVIPGIEYMLPVVNLLTKACSAEDFRTASPPPHQWHQKSSTSFLKYH
jgi:hypothetical protein